MGSLSRRKARELALRVLYQREVGPTDPTRALTQALASPRLDDDAREFARALVLGTIEHLEEIDQQITDSAEGWRSDRMPHIDRNVLRMGLYELLFGGVPAAICINEAVYLARKFSTVESGRFINGILGRLAESRGRDGDSDG